MQIHQYLNRAFRQTMLRRSTGERSAPIPACKEKFSKEHDENIMFNIQLKKNMCMKCIIEYFKKLEKEGEY